MQAIGISRYRFRVAGCTTTMNSYPGDCLFKLGLLPEMIECGPRPNGMHRSAMRVALAAFLSIIAAAPAISQDTTAERIDALEKRVRALEAIIGEQRTPDNIISGDPPLASRGISSPAREEDKGQMLLKLTKWSTPSIKEGQYSTSYYVVNYSLQNNYEKTVKAIIGSIKFVDPAGAHILDLKLERYVRMAPGKEVSFKGYHPIDQSIDSEMKFKDLPPEDVRAQLEIKKIMFGDNTVINLR